ncbi:MAG: helix-turn-helix domain-containing protein [Acidobacteriota bacterium]
MGTFGEDLRMERLSRGIALEHITAVTKISQRHLIALEQDRFRLLPGGILSKGIVRGYASALGLDQNDWTERFLNASRDSGEIADDRNWAAFASNVGKSRIMKREAAEMRLRWLGVALLLFAMATIGIFTVRIYGVRVGWWPAVLPTHSLSGAFHAAASWIHNLFSRLQASIQS